MEGNFTKHFTRNEEVRDMSPKERFELRYDESLKNLEEGKISFNKLPQRLQQDPAIWNAGRIYDPGNTPEDFVPYEAEPVKNKKLEDYNPKIEGYRTQDIENAVGKDIYKTLEQTQIEELMELLNDPDVRRGRDIDPILEDLLGNYF
jgi:hypothetical protein